MERVSFFVTALILCSANLSADNSILLKKVSEGQSSAFQDVDSLALKINQQVIHMGLQGGPVKEMIAESEALYLWFPKKRSSFARQTSEAGNARTPLRFEKPITLFNTLAFEGLGFEAVFKDHQAKPLTMVETVDHGIKATFVLNEGRPKVSKVSYTFDERFAYWPILLEHRIGNPNEVGKLRSRETREFAIHDGIVYPTLVEQTTFDELGKAVQICRISTLRISVNLDSHRSIIHSDELTELALFGSNPTTN